MFNHINEKKRYILNQNGSSKVLDLKEEITCVNCSEDLSDSIDYNLYKVCPFCRHHFYLDTKNRIDLVVDDQTFHEYYEDFESSNPLEFPDYDRKLAVDRQKTGLNEAISVGLAEVCQQKCVIAVMDKSFRMGSMGTVVGEKIAKGAELALDKRVPYVVFTASGGARMQEGVLSLMQMAKTTAVFNQLKENGLLSIVIITNPTTGGVSASFVNIADILLAEPKATYSFAGKKVIEQTIHEKLPEDFQQSEFSFKAGHIDRIVDRKDLKNEIGLLLNMHGKETERREFL